MAHPADCALCPLGLPGEHVYVDPASQARRLAAARAFNARLTVARSEISPEQARTMLTEYKRQHPRSRVLA